MSSVVAAPGSRPFADKMRDVIGKIAPIGVLRIARRAALGGEHVEKGVELARCAGFHALNSPASFRTGVTNDSLHLFNRCAGIV